MGKYIIGIDLGTTNSCVAIYQDKKAKVLENESGNRTTPSVVAFLEDDEKLVGEPAKRQMATNPNTIYSAKRILGMKYKDKSVQDFSKLAGFKICEHDTNGDAWISANGKKISPSQISADILKCLKNSAEAKLGGTTITQAVITVPAYFNDAQRQATKDAAKIAGLEVPRIINEPTAAAISYGLDKGDKKRVIACYDLGGGTFDVSILESEHGVVEVLSTSGNSQLGGDDFDMVICQYIIDEFKKAENIDLSKDSLAKQRIREAAEAAKKDLSSTVEVKIYIPFVTACEKTGPKHVDLTLTRAQFEKLISPLVEKTRAPCLDAMKEASISTTQIDAVLLVGGSTRVPLVQKIVKEIFGQDPSKEVNPDEAVALGACIQAGVLSGDCSDMLLLDVCSLSLGIETLGGVFTKIIPRNTTIPTKKSQCFTTAEDNQCQVQIRVGQGERDMMADNKLVGEFNLTEIPPARRGCPQVEVTFDIDANGICHVSARDKGTGKETKITIQSNAGLSDSEIEKMCKDAEINSEADKKKKDLITEKNECDSLIYTTEQSLNDNGDKVPSEIKDKVQKELNEFKEKVPEKIDDNSDYEGMKSCRESFLKTFQEFSEALYKNNSTEGDATAGTDSSTSADDSTTDKKEKEDENVVDSEYEEVSENDDKDKKKK